MEDKSRADITVNTENNIVEIPGHTIRVRDWDVYYIKVGHGPKVVFLLPGTFGTIYSDYPYLINEIDEDKFTAIFWETPGYGRSLPLKRDYKSNSGNYYLTDADMAHEFLEALGIKKCSVVGWCSGGIIGMILASKHPENVEKLVIFGCKAYITQEELEVFNHLSDVKKWSPRMLESKLITYGIETFQKILTESCTALNENFKPDGDICKDYVKGIKCPTFLLYAGKDSLLPRFHFEYLCQNIKNLKSFEYPDGQHNFHLKYAEDFNKRIQEFLLEP